MMGQSSCFNISYRFPVPVVPEAFLLSGNCL